MLLLACFAIVSPIGTVVAQQQHVAIPGELKAMFLRRITHTKLVLAISPVAADFVFT